MGEGSGTTEFYFMTDDLQAEMQALQAKGVSCSEVTEARWGTLTRIALPSGAEVGLYQPSHASPLVAPPA
jgi:hypothetical protein